MKNNINKDEHVMDNSFLLEDKNNHKWIFVVIIFILLIGGGYYFYNEYTNPKKIYLNIYNNLKNNNEIDKYNNEPILYNSSLNINCDIGEYKEILDIINNISIRGKLIFDKDKDRHINDISVSYKSKKFLDFKYQIKDNNYYMDLKELYDKIIKLNSDSTNKKDTYEMLSGLDKIIVKSLDKAKYKTKIEKVDKKYMLVSIIKIDEYFLDTIISELLEDDEFISVYANINDMSKEDVYSYLNEIRNNNLNKEYDISIYSDIFTKNISKIKINNEDKKLDISKKDAKYYFEYIDEDNLKYEGSLEKGKINYNDSIKVVIKSVDSKTTLEWYLNYGIINEMIQDVDTSNTINYEDISEDDINEISGKILNNIMEVFDFSDKTSYLKEISLNELEDKIKNKDSFILLVSQTGCSHCIDYKPKLENVINKYGIEVSYIEIDLLSDTEYSEFEELISIKGTPTTVFIVSGEEDTEKRIVGSISEDEIYEKLKKYGYIKE